MEKQIERQCRANAVFTDEAYLKTRYICREDGTYTIRVGRGERRDVLACKELYGKAVKTALELDCTAAPLTSAPRQSLGRTAFLLRQRASAAARTGKNSRCLAAGSRSWRAAFPARTQKASRCRRHGSWRGRSWKRVIW